MIDLLIAAGVKYEERKDDMVSSYDIHICIRHIGQHKTITDQSTGQIIHHNAHLPHKRTSVGVLGGVYHLIHALIIF